MTFWLILVRYGQCINSDTWYCAVQSSLHSTCTMYHRWYIVHILGHLFFMFWFTRNFRKMWSGWSKKKKKEKSKDRQFFFIFLTKISNWLVPKKNKINKKLENCWILYIAGLFNCYLHDSWCLYVNNCVMLSLYLFQFIMFML